MVGANEAARLSPLPDVYSSSLSMAYLSELLWRGGGCGGNRGISSVTLVYFAI